MLTIAVIVVVSSALLLGAIWGIYGKLSARVEGEIVALAGGALMVSAILELIEPALDIAPIWAALSSVLLGAAVFSVLDYAVQQIWGSESGGGLLLAITFDGVPENLALGVALIGAGPLHVAALSGSIFLSNLPEAAGGAKEMADDGRSKGKVLALWGATAVLLSAAALTGNFLLSGVPEDALALIRCFAAGAVVATLAIEVFPKGFRGDGHRSGVTAAVGVILAFALTRLEGS